MAKYLIEVEVNEDKLRRSKGIDVGEENEYEESVDTLILGEMGWVDESGIYVTKITELPGEENGIPTVEEFAKQISNIVSQDTEEKTDGQCLDDIIDLMKKYGIYK